MAKEEKNVIVVPSFYLRDYDKNRGEVFEYRKEMATKQVINEDYDLDETITNDMGEIWHEVGGQDGYRSVDGKIQKYIEGHEYYDVDWGCRHEKGFWTNWCDDTPENRKKYGLKSE